jgi:hypothetical protein
MHALRLLSWKTRKQPQLPPHGFWKSQHFVAPVHAGQRVAAAAAALSIGVTYAAPAAPAVAASSALRSILARSDIVRLRVEPTAGLAPGRMHENRRYVKLRRMRAIRLLSLLLPFETAQLEPFRTPAPASLWHRHQGGGRPGLSRPGGARNGFIR